MQTKTLIQASANVVKVTALEIGNTVKVIEKDFSDTKILYGIVTDLLNSGTNTHVEILLFERQYNDITAKIKVYSGDKDIALFPATPEEVESELQDGLKRLHSSIDKKKEELQTAINAYEKTKSFVSGEMSRKLTASSFSEVETAEYLAGEAEKQRQIEALKEA